MMSSSLLTSYPTTWDGRIVHLWYPCRVAMIGSRYIIDQRGHRGSSTYDVIKPAHHLTASSPGRLIRLALWKRLARSNRPSNHNRGVLSNEGEVNVPVIYVQDEVARIFQHSKRAEEEFGALSTIARHCAGLAHYVQSPLNEYATLGSDITAISFDEDSQQLVRFSPLESVNI